MKKRVGVGAVALSAILALGAYTQFRPSSGGHVYTVAQVAAGLAHHPRDWAGRTVLVRGIAVIVDWENAQGGMGANVCPSLPPCAMTFPSKTVLYIFLVGGMSCRAAACSQLLGSMQAARRESPASVSTPPNLVLKLSPRPSLWDKLIHIPLLGQFVSQPYTLLGGTPQTYPMLVRPHRTASCTPVCEDGLLLRS
jgi:hypothetical protein